MRFEAGPMQLKHLTDRKVKRTVISCRYIYAVILNPDCDPVKLTTPPIIDPDLTHKRDITLTGEPLFLVNFAEIKPDRFVYYRAMTQRFFPISPLQSTSPNFTETF